jgi:branched-chain amino acid transport system ATP-binding protein
METMLKTEPLLSVRHMVTGYGDLRVVWDVSLDVRSGEITALLGRNGAGKSTVLRAIAGLNKLDGGSVRFAGHDIDRLSPHKRVRRGLGIVQENKRIFKRRTVEANLLLGGYSRHVGRRQLRSSLEEIYGLFPALRGRAGTPAGQLSGGQQQMVAIGQAIMGRPKVLMLDEPSAGLAPAIVIEVMESIDKLKRSGLGVLLVEQAVETAMSVADHVTVLDVGRIVMASPVGDIDNQDIVKNAYFGRAAGHA